MVIVNPDGSWMTEDEIVEDILSVMTPEDRRTWESIAYEDLITAHFTTGMAIRNQYGLWKPDNPTPSAPYSEYPGDHEMHPDQISMRVIQKVWTRVRSNPKLICRVE